MLTIEVRAKAIVSQTNNYVDNKAFEIANSLMRTFDDLMYKLVENIGLMNMLNSPLY